MCGGGTGKQASDLFAVSCSDGSYRLLTRQGREEKKVDAHSGAVTRIRWNQDGTALLSAGEEGDVKVWSRNGNLRSTLAQTGKPVYALAWGPDNDQVRRHKAEGREACGEERGVLIMGHAIVMVCVGGGWE